MNDWLCFGCGHAKRNHKNGVGLCLVRSCKLCLVYRSGAESGEMDKELETEDV